MPDTANKNTGPPVNLELQTHHEEFLSTVRAISVLPWFTGYLQSKGNWTSYAKVFKHGLFPLGANVPVRDIDIKR